MLSVKVHKKALKELDSLPPDAKGRILEPGYAAAKKDATDIGRLGPMVTDLAAEFEDTITMIRDHPYDEQVQLLTGYKKLLEEQINVIDSRFHFVKRVR